MKTDGGYLTHLACPMAQAQIRPCWDHRGGAGGGVGLTRGLIMKAVMAFHHGAPASARERETVH